LRTGLEVLAARGISSLIVEGGAKLHGAFWDAGLVDRVQMYVATCVLGDEGVAWIAEEVMSSARISARAARPVGDDVLLEGYVHGAD
jgi:diaminohydroxyphosphoribosylaminopyrimidine deaminase/5-amino-6-(5-phosphoribosylamino)uracil reductase